MILGRGPAVVRRPGALPLAAIVVVMAALSPLAFVALQARHADGHTVHRILFRQLAATLFSHTVELSLTVTLTTMVLGFSAAYLLERTDVPLRRTLSVLLAMPLAVPEFVQGWSWVSITSSVRGFRGAVLVMTCALYPLVMLPVAASLRRADPGLEDASRSLGRGWWSTLWRVTLPLCRSALAGGALLVSLYLLGEYGTFAVLRYRTFATQIYTEYRLGFDIGAASVLSLVLCVIAVALVVAEARTSGRGRSARGGDAPRPATRARLGRGTVPALAGVAALLVLALGVPLGTVTYWLVQGNSSTLPSSSIVGATLTSLGYSTLAAVVATLAAVPVALYSWRHNTRLGRALESGAYLSRALPGITVGLAMVFFAIRYAHPLYQRPVLLVVAYAILFFPLSLTAVRGAFARVPLGLEEVARTLGHSRLQVFVRITLPLIAPGLAAAGAMVALSASTELTATLLLAPTGTHTLATEFWKYTTALSFGGAAPYAALMVGLSVVPVLLLSRAGVRR